MPLERIASQITSGGTPSSGSPRYYVEYGGLPFAKTEDLTRARSKFIEDCDLGISESALKETAAKRYPAETILVSMYGTIGLTKITACEMAANQALCALLPPLACDRDYLYHHLDYIRPEWLKHSGQTTQANISGATVRAHVVRLPPRREQQKIAEIFDTLDTAIHETEAIIAKLKFVKQGLLNDLLTRGIGTNGELRPPQTEAPHLYKSSPLGWIPNEWETKQLSDLLADVDPAMRSGPFGSALLKQELTEVGVPLLGIDNVHTECFVTDYTRFVTPRKFAQLARYAVRPSDLMITIMGTVGRCCLVPEDVGLALSSKHTWTISLDQNAYSPYLAMLQVNYSPAVLGHFARDQQGGTMAAIRSETLRSTRLPVPPREEQHLMEERLRALSTRIDLEADSLAKRHAEKSGLMDDLLTGRVRVTPLLAEAAQQIGNT